MTARSVIADATTLLLDPRVNLAEAADRYFGPAFRQCLDGRWSDRAEFVERIAGFRELTDSATIEVHEELIDGPRYAERHTIDIRLKDGTHVRTEAYLFAQRDADGRFTEIREATFTQ